jgi:hypothetical protein
VVIAEADDGVAGCDYDPALAEPGRGHLTVSCRAPGC